MALTCKAKGGGATLILCAGLIIRYGLLVAGVHAAIRLVLDRFVAYIRG